jgi:hypothetical protein
MSSHPGEEIIVWTNEGYEGRFLKWETDSWQAIEHRNYKHWFSLSQPLTSQDLETLRSVYKIPVGRLSDQELERTSPSALVGIAESRTNAEN